MIKSWLFLTTTTTLICGGQAGLVKVPKIYNAIVSSKQNLSPSQAIPLIEPVYRTSALGVFFPPAIVHTVGQPLTPVSSRESPNHQVQNELRYQVAMDPYITYPYNNLLVPTLPIYHHQHLTPQTATLSNKPTAPEIEKEIKIENNHQGVKAAVDFKKNPEVPDVPIPPLPVKFKNVESQQRE